MTSCIGFLISMFGTRMCGQTLLFIVIANCAIARLTKCAVPLISLLIAQYLVSRAAHLQYEVIRITDW